MNTSVIDATSIDGPTPAHEHRRRETDAASTDAAKRPHERARSETRRRRPRTCPPRPGRSRGSWIDPAPKCSTTGESDAATSRVIRGGSAGSIGGRGAVDLAVPAGVARGYRPLAASEDLENMEIGHNVLHGQWDWMGDPEIPPAPGMGLRASAAGWEALAQLHPHTFTNGLGKDVTWLRGDADRSRAAVEAD